MVRALLRCAWCLPVLLAMAGGCVKDQQIIGQAQQFHGALSPAVMEDKVPDRELQQYFDTVGQRIIDVAQEFHQQKQGPKRHHEEDAGWMFTNRMKFHLVNSRTLNAFTTGGEHMYIYNELFQKCRTEDELAAVMAHEYAHIYGRHVQKGTERQYAMVGLTVAAAGAGYVAGGKERGGQYAAYSAAAAQVVGGLGGMKFTRDDEAEADTWGYRFYVRAGWDPNRFGDFFQQMIDLGYDKTPELLSDHPTLASRVKKAKQRAATEPYNPSWRRPPVADAHRFAMLKQKAAQYGRTMPSDKTLANSQELLQALPRSCLSPADPTDRKQAQEGLRQKLVAMAKERQGK